jgi:hypothetical protein
MGGGEGGGGVEGPMFFGPPMPAEAGAQPGRLAIVKTTGNLTLDDSHTCVVCTGATSITVTVPASQPQNAGRIYLIKNVDATKVTLRAAAGGDSTIDGKSTRSIKKLSAVTLIADGEGEWHVIGEVV